MDQVLIAEDDRILLKTLTNVLKKYEDKFKVTCVNDGKEAIEILKRQQVSLLVTDIQMPHVDGLALLAYVSKNHPVIPCLVITAYDTLEIKKKLPKDILHFFPKPFQPDKLGQAILQVLERDIPHGSMYGISVVSFLHMIEMEQKTCLFEIDSPTHGKGVLHFEKGVLWDAVCGDIKGEEAALKIITKESAKFSFKHFPEKKVNKQIKTDLTHLIEEATRREDEQNISEALERIDFDVLDLNGIV